MARRGLAGKHFCKVGACRICGSACKRCKCACNGLKPINALARFRGAQSSRSMRKKIKATQQMPSIRSKRSKAASGGPKSQQESKYNDNSTYVVERSDDNTSNNKQLE